MITYGSGLLIYHLFCDSINLPEEQRAPASTGTIQAFLASVAGAYSKSAINNYLSGIRAWHLYHGIEWAIDDKTTSMMLRATNVLSPPPEPKRTPYTVEYITKVLEQLDSTNTFDVAVAACLTTCFWSAARVREFTTGDMKTFDPTTDTSVSNMGKDVDRKGNATTTFFIPRTKCAVKGETVAWAVQNGPTDPHTALQRHIELNKPLPFSEPLFAHFYTPKGKKRPERRFMSKKVFLLRLHKAALAAGLKPRQGHGIRIGATLEYCLRGTPFSEVRAIGRWAGENSFKRYLRKHAQILAPHLQAVPEIHTAFAAVSLEDIPDDD
jgi:hypothetical protein